MLFNELLASFMKPIWMNRSVGSVEALNIVETRAPAFRFYFVGLAVPPAPV